jgi:Flp pilus assembly protein TadG
MTWRSRPDRPSQSGQAIVEFALVAPVVFLFLFGLISGCFLFFQNSSLHDGASAGARMASVENSLALQQTSGPYKGDYCESDQPASIEQTVAQAAPGLTVNMGRLCTTNPVGAQLTQSTSPANEVDITVTCGGTCANPSSVTVSLVVDAQGLVFPLPFTYVMRATSEVAIESP